MQWHVPRRDRQADFDRSDQAWLPLPGTNLWDTEDQGHLRNKVPVTDRKVKESLASGFLHIESRSGRSEDLWSWSILEASANFKLKAVSSLTVFNRAFQKGCNINLALRSWLNRCWYYFFGHSTRTLITSKTVSEGGRRIISSATSYHVIFKVKTQP